MLTKVKSNKLQEVVLSGRFATTSTVAALTEGPKGCTLTRTDAGKYTLAFDQTYVSVHACVLGDNLADTHKASYDSLTTSSVKFEVQQLSDSAFVDVAGGEISFTVFASKSQWD